MDQIKEKIGVVFQNSVLDGCLSVKDNLFSRASFYGIYGKEAKKRIDELAGLLDFKDLMNRIVGKSYWKTRQKKKSLPTSRGIFEA